MCFGCQSGPSQNFKSDPSQSAQKANAAKFLVKTVWGFLIRSHKSGTYQICLEINLFTLKIQNILFATHIVSKSPKMSHLNFVLYKIDLSGNTV